MTRRPLDRFDAEGLRALAGDAAFARGTAYHRDGQVAILELASSRVLARVSGTEDYRTVVTGRGKRIGGECSCLAFEDSGFCKHMVATALAANEAGEATAGAGALDRIRRHLEGRGIDALVSLILNLAERDQALFRKLDIAAAADSGDAAALETRLRQAIDRATRTRGFVGHREAKEWAEGVEEVVDALAEFAAGPHAGAALRLADHAIMRIETALADVDDSDGHGSWLLGRAQELHLAACRAARPDPVPLARDLLTRETGGDHDIFLGAATVYADVLGTDGLAEYRRLAAETWDALPPRGYKDRETHDNWRYSLLRDILDRFAEGDGDLEARIALRRKDLSSPWSYLQLAEFCQAHGRDDEALAAAEEGLWVFEEAPPDHRLVGLAVDLLLKAGRTADGEAHLWRAFEKQPSPELYRQLRAVGGMPARERALAWLEARLTDARRDRWYNPADLLVRTLTAERLFDRAWAVVHAHDASLGAKEALAEASEATHPTEALAVYTERVRGLVSSGGNPAYAEAVEVIARMAGLRGAAEQGAYVADLKARFGRKRNFMKLLE